MDSLPLLVAFLFVIPTIGIGLALLGAVLHGAARPVAAQTARARDHLGRQNRQQP
jgi:hypothetical protein